MPQYESTVTANLWKSGAVMVGKTNLDEFAMGSSNMTSHFGGVENPWKRRGDNRKLVPGGSSGGSAAAVAAYMVPGSTGTDTGGSIRQPAAFCGIVGLKPTYGRCSRWGVVAFASSLDQPGPFARTVEDTALLLQAMSGHDPKDSTSAPLPVPDFAAAARNPDIKGLKVGIPKEYRVDGTSPEIVALWEKGIEMLKAAGAEPVEVSLPHTKYALPAYYIVAPAECSSNLARYDGVRFGLRVPGKDLTEHVREHARRGLRQGSAPAHPDRHLRAVGRLLRRLLQEGAADPRADRARLQAGLREVRRAADADRADGGLRRRREDGRSGDHVSQRHVHHPGVDGGPAGHLGAGRPRQGRPAARPAADRPRLRRGDAAARGGGAREGGGFSGRAAGY